MCYMGTQLPPAAKGAQQSPTFRSMSLVAKRSPISATAELLALLHDTAVVGNIHYTVIPPAGVRPMKVLGRKFGILNVVISLYNVWLGQCMRTFALEGTA